MKQQNDMSIEAIIFDLGGVVINTDTSLSYRAFQTLSKNQNHILTPLDPLFINLEKGIINNKKFFALIREKLNTKTTDNEIAKAWNAMLLDIPLYRMLFIEKLKEKYRVMVLSNTNDIHISGFEKIMNQHYGVERYYALFEKIWYSHKIGHRKPDKSAFDYVLKDANLKPNKTLLVDDTIANIEAAKQMGLQTLHIEKGKDILTEMATFM